MKQLSFLVMPSTSKQKAKEKRSRQSDIMSDLEEKKVALGNFPMNDNETKWIHKIIEADSAFGRLHKISNTTGEDFRSSVTQIVAKIVR